MRTATILIAMLALSGCSLPAEPSQTLGVSFVSGHSFGATFANGPGRIVVTENCDSVTTAQPDRFGAGAPNFTHESELMFGACGSIAFGGDSVPTVMIRVSDVSTDALLSEWPANESLMPHTVNATGPVRVIITWDSQNVTRIGLPSFTVTES